MISFDEVIESYYLETQEGLFFAVKGLEHPPDRLISVLRYAPDPIKGDRKRRGIAYRRLYHFGEQEQFLQSFYPHFLAYDPVFQTTLQSVPKSLIRRVYDPVARLQEMSQDKLATTAEEEAVAFAALLQKQSGVPLSDIGISGSLLIGLHTEHSDLDISVIGSQSCKRIYRTLRRLLNDRSMEDLSRFEMDGIEELYNQRVADTNIPFDQFVCLERNKVCQGTFRRRPYFVRFIRKSIEGGTQYGSVQYIPLGRAKIAAAVADDSEAIFTPCRYTLKDVQILAGPPAPVSEIVSFRGRFCEQARSGETIHAAGLVERIESKQGEIRYRLLLGNSAHDTMVPG